MDVDEAVAELRERLRRHDERRYPVQHATAQFHLGVVLLEADRVEQAVAALRTAVRLFDPQRLPVEHAKATNMLGAALRQRGQPAAAAEAFAWAAGLFEQHDRGRERAAALFNLGLVQRQDGHADAAGECFRRALDGFDGQRLPGQAAAAARELGTTQLAGGEAEAAAATLRRAVDLARQAGDQAGVGAAANVLGLALLGRDRLQEAVEAFRQAVAANPRGVRPEGFAMAKANLALAYEQAGDPARARLAARQALAVAEAPQPVTGQASAVLERLGPGGDDLHVVLDQEPADRWPALIRDEAARWRDQNRAARRRALEAWVDGQLTRPGRAGELAEAWLGVLLELPPAAMEALVVSTLEALAGRDAGARGRFRSDVSSAMARFHVPQWMRLKDTFNGLAAQLGQEASWG